MRNASIAVLRKIGVETGGSNVQFADQPERWAALDYRDESPGLALVGAGLQRPPVFPLPKSRPNSLVGYTLDELRNEITGGRRPRLSSRQSTTLSPKCHASPSRSFPQAADRLTTQMKSVGEVMAIGRTFQESLQKALRGLETGIDGLTPILLALESDDEWSKLRHELSMPGSQRLRYVADAFRFGMPFEELQQLTRIDPWFLVQIEELVAKEAEVIAHGADALEPVYLHGLEAPGLQRQSASDSDRQTRE